jgi:sigma-B regulation protein RsbU (phosphoserine phosphatase)
MIDADGDRGIHFIVAAGQWGRYICIEERTPAMALKNYPIRDGLIVRRRRLEKAIASAPGNQRLEGLLQEVESALERFDKGTYGLCDVCHEPIEPERLAADPTVCICLDHLSTDEQRALEDDLAVASQIQRGLLPEQEKRVMGWETAYYYEPAGLVSGDYCDLLSHGGSFYFTVGDVSGKGVSAAMLMTHLHTTLRTLVFQSLPLEKIMEQASRMFCESSLPSHFATLALGRANADGDIDLCMAGHVPALIAHGPRVRRIDATDLPLGMFCHGHFSVTKVHLDTGQSVLLYTDGLSESLDPSGTEYGIDRLQSVFKATSHLPPQEIVTACLADLESFRSGTARFDDLTLMVLRRSTTTAGDGSSA